MSVVRLTLITLVVSLSAFATPASAQDAQARLWDASISGDTAAIRKAVVDGAVVDSLDTRTSQNGRRPLNWAAFYNRVDAVKLLIELKAPVNATNKTGFTALHHAAEAGALDAAKALLAAGADPNRTMAAGYNAATIARMRDHADVATVIEAAAARKAN